jgi:hypothetical protein
MPKLVCISGSYRPNGITAQSLEVVVAVARDAGWDVEIIPLVDFKIEYCHNCRRCAQAPGVEWGECPIPDDARGIIRKALSCDALVLASPTNFYDVTAITRIFLERLVGCSFWKWGVFLPPKMRSTKKVRPALLISSAMTPAFLARLITHSLSTLAMMAECFSAKVVGRVFLGGVAVSAVEPLVPSALSRLRKATRALLMVADKMSARAGLKD